MAVDSALIEVKGFKKYFPIERGFLRRVVGHVKAVDDVDFSINSGETLGLVGESGCGKTTLGRCILRGVEPTAGRVLFRADDGDVIDIISLDREALRLRRRQMQMIFQDPYGSLDPRMTLLDIIGEPLLVNQLAKGRALEDRVHELALKVGLNVKHLKRYPHAFSGGQRQRVGIARALATNPRFIVADEPVSALDVSIQAQILNLLQDLQQEFGLTYLFVAHDLSVIQYISDRVAVMYVGKLVETARTQDLYMTPRHPYTEALLSAVPKPNPRLKLNRIVLKGEVANPADPPSGCYFHPRCRYKQDICSRSAPPLQEVKDHHAVACHLAHKLDLTGVSA